MKIRAVAKVNFGAIFIHKYIRSLYVRDSSWFSVNKRKRAQRA